jgi:hypothetical protein
MEAPPDPSPTGSRKSNVLRAQPLPIDLGQCAVRCRPAGALPLTLPRSSIRQVGARPAEVQRA